MSESSSSHLKLVEEVIPKTVTTVRQSVGLAAQDIKFYKSLDKIISQDLDDCSGRLLELARGLVKNIDRKSGDDLDIDADLIENSWKDVGNVLDSLFEKADIAFDDYNRPSKGNDQKLTYLEDSGSKVSDRTAASKRLEKPQLKFRIPVDNSESGPFVPKISSKPNAIEPFEESMKLVDATPDVPSHHKQPYEVEIETQEYPESTLTIRDPVESKNWLQTEATWVDTVEALEEMVKELQHSSEIAVDLEHHDYRTYYGIVCLMQISNRERDWIVDTLLLRDDLQPLNVVFTDPKIVKVFHGAFMDIIWLQRDLGLYIVSLFDTYHASRLLGFPKHSLLYLLERFAQFKTSKKYQLADWRMRPLSEAMMSYARSDTHFLLNIYDQLRNMLIRDDKLKDVLYESRKVAKKRFEYTKFRPSVPTSLVVSPLNEKLEPWRPLMYQYNLPESKRHLLVDLYNWRDQIARKNDESVRYVMPNQLLVSLAAGAPTDSHGVLASGSFITDYVRFNAKEIASLIEAAVKKSDEEDLKLMSTVHDEYEDSLSVEKIDAEYLKDVHNRFLALVLKAESVNSVKKPIIEKAKGFISGVDDKNVFSVEYKRGDVVAHDVHDSQERLKVVEDKFALKALQEVAVLADLLLQAPLETVVAQEDDEPEAEAEEEVKEDPNEVITLRKKNKNKGKAHATSSNGRESSEEAGEAFDYSSAKKILVQPTIKEKRQLKKRSFDPYSQVSEGPRAPKKVQRINIGKSSTFKQKRK